METVDDRAPVIDPQENSSHTDVSSEQSYIVYTRRWYILFVIFILSFSNAAVWLSFAPVADRAAEFYGVSLGDVNWFALIYPIAALPFSPASSWLLDTWGLRAGIIVSSAVNLCGCVVRYVGSLSFVAHSSMYPVTMFGQALAACAQPVYLIIPAKVAAVWFKDSQRATANMIASMANPLGILAANALAPVIVPSAQDIPYMMLAMTVPAALGFVLAVSGVCSSEPPTPPTASAEEISYPFIQGLKKCLRDRQFLLLSVGFGVGVGLFTSLSSLLEQILCPWHYTDTFAGLCGALIIGAGVLGAAVAGAVADKTKRFEESAKICYTFAAVSSIAFTLLYAPGDREVLVCISLSAFGLFGFAIYPICLELAVECTFPVAEATSAGILVIVGQLMSIVLMLGMQELAPMLSPSSLDTCGGQIPQDYKIPMYCFSGVAMCGAMLFTIFFRSPYKRLQVEQQNAVDKAQSKVL